VRLNDERHAALLRTLRGSGEPQNLGDEELLKPLFNRDASAPIDNLRTSMPAPRETTAPISSLHD
jgi:hypothetical protein